MSAPKHAPGMLDCPDCGVPLIPAIGRGRYDRDGNYAEHREGCRCSWCDWMWFDDMKPVKCACGSVVRVECDDSVAFAVAEESGSHMEAKS